MPNKLKTLDQIKEIAETAKNQNKRIVTTNGCFDIFHAGHASLLTKAKRLGDILIVGLNSDTSIKRIKPGRPIVPENERATVLAALESVDYIVLFQEDTPHNYLKAVKPHIHVKGTDRSIDQIIEKDILEKLGAELKLIQITEGVSTTNIIEKILDKHKKGLLTS